MLLFCLIFLPSHAQLIQQTYSQVPLQLKQELNPNISYIVRMDVIQFPKSSIYLPQMTVIGREIYNDSANIFLRAESQQVYLVNQSEILINISVYSVTHVVDDNITMMYNISVIENASQPLNCIFPNYGQTCNNQMVSLEVQVEYTLEVSPSQWYFGFIKINNREQYLQISTDDQLFGLSVLPLDKPTVTQLPSFETLFQILQPNQKLSINLTNENNIQNYVVAFGVYNFNNNDIKTVDFSIVNSSNNSLNLPDWVYVIIGISISIGIIASIIICYQIHRQTKILTYEKPALEKKILDKYIPAVNLSRQYANEQCSVCIMGFDRNEKIRITPCLHVFHDECLSGWYFFITIIFSFFLYYNFQRTHKQANCPNCRKDLNELELQRQRQPSIVSFNQDQSAQQQVGVSSPFIPLGTTSQINIRSSPDVTESSPTNQKSSERLFNNDLVMNDQIIEK